MSTVATTRPVTLWRVERLRLLRSHRWVALAVVFVLCGVTGPLLARYAGALFAGAAGTGITVVAPAPVPADGITGFLRSALQLGALVVVVVAASALCLDARPAVAVFYRTRVRRAVDLVAPRVVVTTVSSLAALVLGLGVAWYETAVLIGAPAAGPVLLGTACAALYLTFLVAVVAVCAAAGAGVAVAAGSGVAVTLLLPLLGTVHPLAAWLPSRLTTAADDLLHGGSAGDVVRSVAVTVVVTVALWAAAVVLSGRRQPIENVRS